MFKLFTLVLLLFSAQIVRAACSTDLCEIYRGDFRILARYSSNVYCYTDMKQTQFNKNFDTLADEYQNKLNDAMTANEYIWLLKQWAAEFHDGHVNFMPGTLALDYRVTKFDISLAMMEPATPKETLVVVASKDPRIPVGSIVNQINGQPALEAVTNASKYSSGSTERMRRRNAGITVLSSLTFENKSVDHEISITTPNKDNQNINVHGVQVPYGSEPVPADPQSTVKFEILPGGILHISISQFIGADEDEDDGTAEEFANLMDKTDLTQIKGIVLDLRRNRGGSTIAYQKILGYFVKRAINTYYISPRINPTTLELRPALKNWPTEGDTGFGVWRMQHSGYGSTPSLADLPLITLISPYCFSACDTMVAALKSNHIGTIVGEPTGGGTGTPIVFQLPRSYHQFRYSVNRGKTLEGTFIEGVGTEPDFYIPQTVKDIQDQTDYQLQAAIAHFSPAILSLLHRLPVRKLAEPEVNPLNYSSEYLEQYLNGIKE